MVDSHIIKRKLGLESNPARTRRYWRALFLEFFATAVFVFCACASVVDDVVGGVATVAQNLLAGLVQGFALAALISAIVKTSGGHINPAVTFGLMVSGDMPILNGLGYIAVQAAGGIVGAALLSGVLPGRFEGQLGTTTLQNGISIFQGYLFETFVTFLLVFTVFGSAMDKDGLKIHFAPIPIGLAVVAGVAIAFPWTGGSLNPARTFGPAVISHTWRHHYVYWAGPFTGALIAAIIYRFIIKTKPTQKQEMEILQRNRANSLARRGKTPSQVRQQMEEQRESAVEEAAMDEAIAEQELGTAAV